MKTALILGINGYLGQNLMFWLLKEEFYIIGVDVNEKISGLEYIDDDSKVKYIKADLTLESDVKKIPLNECDVVYMLVGKTGTINGFNEYSEFVKLNQITLLNILKEYTEKKSQARFIFPTSRLVYKGQKNTFLNEDSLKEAKTIYAVNKLACERILECWANAYNMKYTIFRICVPYGQLIPGEYSYGTLGFMINQAKNNQRISIYGDGRQKRTFSHVGDICEILGYVPFLINSKNKIINIGSNDNFQLMDLAKRIAKLYSAHIVSQEWPVRDKLIESGDTMFDDSLLQSLFPYKYKRSINNFLESLN